jgi:hypothetical protein
MKIIAVQFDYPGQNKYDILAKVLEYSVKKNCPSANFELIKLDAPIIKRKMKSKSFASNTLKMEYWLKALKETDENVIFIDCDTIVLHDLSNVFDDDYDIGYTKRTGSRLPYNGGVVFVKNTPNAIEFIELWNDVNKRMYDDWKFHCPWRNKYAGMNQAAFGYIMEKETFNAKLKQFSCAEMNACTENWPKINKDTKVIHIKGALRRAAFNVHRPNDRCYRALVLWHNLAIESGAISGERLYDIGLADRKRFPKRLRGLRRRYRR